jgi:phosphoserine phosphatase
VGSVIFDFDSTLVPCETLEELCKQALRDDPAGRRELERITDAGMDGSMSFETSLRRRLAIARPGREAVLELGHSLGTRATAGAAALVTDLQAAGHEVWIVSGGFRDLLLAAGGALGIPAARIHGVGCRWAPDGSLEDLEADDGFVISKVEGLSRLAPVWPAPAVGVGDGATDLALREAGFVQHFVAYTEHARRPVVTAGADFEAATMGDLRAILERLLA